MIAAGLSFLALGISTLAGASCANPLSTNDLVMLRRPTGAELERVYPARTEMPDGRAVVLCSIGPSGKPAQCVVSEETPGGFGLGAATIKAARYFAFGLIARDGTSTPGRCVRIPITWRMS